MSDGNVLGRLSFDMFKYHLSEAFDINDGKFSIQCETGKDHLRPILEFRIFKPKFGQPQIEKVRKSIGD